MTLTFIIDYNIIVHKLTNSNTFINRQFEFWLKHNLIKALNMHAKSTVVLLKHSMLIKGRLFSGLNYLTSLALVFGINQYLCRCYIIHKHENIISPSYSQF